MMFSEKSLKGINELMPGFPKECDIPNREKSQTFIFLSFLTYHVSFTFKLHRIFGKYLTIIK